MKLFFGDDYHRKYSGPKASLLLIIIIYNGLPPPDDGVTGCGHQRDQGPARHLCL